MWLIGSIITVAVVVLSVFPSVRRSIVTVLLIVQVKPYERTIEGAPVILVAGDSTGYGTGARAGKQTIAGYVGADFPQYSIKNISVNGHTTHDLIGKLKELPADSSYALILLQIGGNDILKDRPLSEVRQDIQQVLTEAKQRSAHVVLSTTGNVGAAAAFVKGGEPNQHLMEKSQAVHAVFREVASEYEIPYVDYYVEPSQDVFLQDPDTYMAADGLHPSGAGYQEWYKKLQPTLNNLLHK